MAASEMPRDGKPETMTFEEALSWAIADAMANNGSEETMRRAEESVATLRAVHARELAAAERSGQQQVWAALNEMNLEGGTIREHLEIRESLTQMIKAHEAAAFRCGQEEMREAAALVMEVDEYREAPRKIRALPLRDK